MNGFILVVVLATSYSSQSGAAAVVAEFSNRAHCEVAGKELTTQAIGSKQHVLAWGCFQK